MWRGGGWHTPKLARAGGRIRALQKVVGAREGRALRARCSVASEGLERVGFARQACNCVHIPKTPSIAVDGWWACVGVVEVAAARPARASPSVGAWLANVDGGWGIEWSGRGEVKLFVLPGNAVRVLWALSAGLCVPVPSGANRARTSIMWARELCVAPDLDGPRHRQLRPGLRAAPQPLTGPWASARSLESRDAPKRHLSTYVHTYQQKNMRVFMVPHLGEKCRVGDFGAIW